MNIKVIKPRWHILANISGTNDFRDMERYRHIYFFNSVCVLRFDSPLLFTNVERFRKIVDKLANDWNNVRCCGKIDKRHLIGEQNEKHENQSDSSHPTKRYLIIDCSGFAYVDVMGVNSLKECVLGSIIVVALLGMFEKFTQLPRLWRLSKIDFSIWVVAFVATIGIDVMQGLAIAIAFALFTT
ncbi:STAS domain protein, partial [Ancylostoma duodenale]